MVYSPTQSRGRIRPAWRSFWSSAVCTLLLSALRCFAAEPAADVLVYGGSASGVTAAVAAARLGKRVVLVEPGRHLGGLTAGGLGMTDVGSAATIGGLSREFYRRVHAHYTRAEAWKAERRQDYVDWMPLHFGYDGKRSDQAGIFFLFEPHVAEQVFRDWLREVNVQTVFGERLDLRQGVRKEGPRIVAIRMVGNDERCPEPVRREMRRWGLAKDEFVDTGHWPFQLYVREARRMVSDYVMTEHDARGRRQAKDSVALASYHSDSHGVTLYVDEEGRLCREKGFFVATGIFPISYRAIRPRAAECTNLLVPMCLSSSHAAYGPTRMEPVFMMLGHSAGTAASLALDRHVSVQDLPYPELRSRLLAEQQILDRSALTSTPKTTKK